MLCWGSNNDGRVILRTVADFYLWISAFAALGEEPLVADIVGFCSSEITQQHPENPETPLPFLLSD